MSSKFKTEIVGGNTQVGDGNLQINANVQAFVEVAKQIEASDASEGEKRSWRDAILQIAAGTIGPAAVAAIKAVVS